MTYMEWVIRIKRYRPMEYMNLSFSERSKIRAEYIKWFKQRYHREPANISI